METLVSLGLETEEAQLYLHLSIRGASKASDVAKTLGLSRAETYRKLQKLVQRGFASATLHRPTQFVATPPDNFFQSLIETQETLLERIRGAQEPVTRALAGLRRGEAPPTIHEETFRIVTGRREFYRLATQMLRRATHQFEFLNTNEGGLSQAEKTGLWALVGRRARGGLAAKVVMRGSGDLERRVAALEDAPGFAYRPLRTETPIRFAIADGRELLISVIIEPVAQLTAKQDVSIHTDAPDFVGTLREFFQITWEEGAAPEPPALGASIADARVAARLMRLDARPVVAPAAESEKKGP